MTERVTAGRFNARMDTPPDPETTASEDETDESRYIIGLDERRFIVVSDREMYRLSMPHCDRVAQLQPGDRVLFDQREHRVRAIEPF